MLLGHGDTKQDGGRNGWWSRAAHIMAARKEVERQEEWRTIYNLQGHASYDLTSSTFHLLKVPPPHL
jgi:hypothetical protein